MSMDDAVNDMKRNTLWCIYIYRKEIDKNPVGWRRYIIFLGWHLICWTRELERGASPHQQLPTILLDNHHKVSSRRQISDQLVFSTIFHRRCLAVLFAIIRVGIESNKSNRAIVL
jgi:hypothetical protein